MLLEKKSLKESISSKLDYPHNGSAIYGWRRLLELLNDREILNGKEAFLYKTNYYGGGSPTLAMFDAIIERWPDASLQNLIEKLRNIERNDVALHLIEIIQARASVKLLKDLTTKDKMYFKKLDGQGSNWEFLAEEYGFTSKEQNFFKAEQARPNKWSPTEAVLEDVIATSPNLSLKDFITILGEMERDDLVNDIEKFIKNIKHQQQR